MTPLILFLALIVIPFLVNRSLKASNTGIGKFYAFLSIISLFGLYAVINVEYKSFVRTHVIFVDILFFIAFFTLFSIVTIIREHK